jgi:hypothetical protein
MTDGADDVIPQAAGARAAVRSTPSFAGRFGLCARVSRQHFGVLPFMLGAQRQVPRCS